MNLNPAWDEYFQGIKGKYGTEMTFRTPLENLLNAIRSDDRIKITHEPKREKGFGAPDFKVEKSGAIIGYVETKELRASLDELRKAPQIKKYLKLRNNLILTNYKEFLLIKSDKGNVDSRVVLFFEHQLEKPRSRLDSLRVEELEDLFEKFFLAEPEEIAGVKPLASALAERGKILKEYILEELRKDKQEDGRFSESLKALHGVFKDTLILDLKESEFADAYSQTVIYGLLLAYFSSNKKIDRSQASKFIPAYFEVLLELLKIIDFNDPPRHLIWIFDEIVGVVNNINARSIKKELSFYSGQLPFYEGEHRWEDFDPYYYFYEPFLREFDAMQKKGKGVFYTPIPVVSFIVRSIEQILTSVRFDKQGAFANSAVTTLDFACGTGTFLAFIFERVLSELESTHRKGEIKKHISEHLLKRFYGFEYLIAPYAVAHMKLSQLIKEKGYEFADDDRIQVYLTDTLDRTKHKAVPVFTALNHEGQTANRIKDKEQILVVTGNPPYNNRTKNKSLWMLGGKRKTKDGIQTYKALLDLYKPEGEKKLNLNDDYIQFIRFAHYKMSQVEKGIIGIISNNSYLSGITHRKMRAELLKEFDEIYILNLHGNGNIGETAPDGGKDENVFLIRSVGVAVVFFIKTGKKKAGEDGKVLYCDCYGRQAHKFKFLRDNDLNSLEWKEANFREFDKALASTRWGQLRFPYFKFFEPASKKSIKLIQEYGSSWGMEEIFATMGSGIQTDRDSLLVDFETDKLEAKLKKAFAGDYDEEFTKQHRIENSSSYNFKDRLSAQKFEEEAIRKVHYRPFDERKVYYKVGFTSRPAEEVMSHFLAGENVGLGFSRQSISGYWGHTFILDEIAERCFVSLKTRECGYIAPLYLYEEKPPVLGHEFEKPTKRPNFNKEFLTFINDRYSFEPTPEQVLGYIYSILNSSEYRKRYFDLLTIDYPRVPFTKDGKLFKKLSDLGWELIQHHLMNKQYSKRISSYPEKRKDNSDLVEKVVVTVNKDKKAIRVNINKEQYFDGIPKEVWNFYIGGYKVLEHWLKERTGRELSKDELNHFHNVVNIINETIKLMVKIDRAIGDWPIK